MFFEYEYKIRTQKFYDCEARYWLKELTINQTVNCFPISNWTVGKYFQLSTSGRLLLKKWLVKQVEGYGV
jgi:hypothetical protein